MLGIALLFAHGAALLVLLPLTVPAWLRALIALLVIASLWQSLRAQVLLRGSAVTRLLWDTDDEWTLFTANGRELPARLLSNSYVHPWLVILNFSHPGRWTPCAVVLTRDSLDPLSHRQLRVRLTMYSAARRAEPAELSDRK